MKLFVLLFAAAAYLLFNVVFIYLDGFLLGAFVPKAINDGTVVPIAEALAVNLAAIFLFGFLHSLMARKGFKKHWTKLVPPSADRSVYVVQTSLSLGLVFWVWRPLPEVIWSFGGAAVWPFYAVFLAGNVIALLATLQMGHLEFFGISQVWHDLRGREVPAERFRTPGLYRFVRHPMQSGMLMLLWSTPHMTAGHALFASSMTLYCMIGLWFEERSLRRQFGADYVNYSMYVPKLFPRILALEEVPERDGS